MSEEEIDVLYNEILNLPKIERPITATTQCEINVNDLFDTIRAFRKIPNYNELIKDNRKKNKEIERLNNIINELEKEIDNFDVFKEFSFPLMKRWEEEQVKSSIDYEWRKTIKEPFLNKIKELKGNDK